MPAVGLEERGLDGARLGLVDRATAGRREVGRVGLGLRLQDAVDRGDQLDELVDRPVALLGRQLGIARTHSSSSRIACWLSSRQ